MAYEGTLEQSYYYFRNKVLNLALFFKKFENFFQFLFDDLTGKDRLAYLFPQDALKASLDGLEHVGRRGFIFYAVLFAYLLEGNWLLII